MTYFYVKSIDMKYSNFLNKQWKKESIYEFSASFFFVLLYFLSIEHAIDLFSSSLTVFGSVIYTILYFLIVTILSKMASVHILPVVSFIEYLNTGSLYYFFCKVANQFMGALLAIILHIWVLRYGSDSDLSNYATPLNPFFIGLFTGFLSQIIYLLHLILWRLQIYRISRYFLFSVGLGFVFAIISVIGSITLLNPFGLLLHYLISGNPITIKLIFTGSMVHILIPMIFVSGTHYFLKGFVIKGL